MSSAPAPTQAASLADGPTITVNDESRSVATNATIATLASDLGFADRKGIAVAVNGEVVPRVNWVSRSLRSGDRVLVIRATQGG